MRIKAYLSVLSEPPLPALLTVSFVAWLLLLQNGHVMSASAHLGHHHNVGHVGDNLLTQFPLSWLIMLVAMMAPLLAEPIGQLWSRSLPHRRLKAVSFFVIAYIFIWMLAGILMSEVSCHLQTLSGTGWLTVPGLALLIAIVWQASPWKQVCLNYCHWKPRLSPFGLNADWDCLRFGAVKGGWCVGSCWALMFLPFAFVHASHLLMLIIGLILLVERYQPARPARWQIPLFRRILN